MKISPAMRASDAFVTRRALLVPICLCIIAAGHAYRVFACGQTAWKGGGFGMFSTIDAENARYVKIYLTTEHGEVPVELPSELRKKAAELRAAPNQEGTEELARRLVKLHWRDSQVAWSHVANAVNQTTNPIVTAAMLHPTDQLHPTSSKTLGSQSTLKPVSKQTTNDIVPVAKVRVEVWRYRYSATTHILTPELLFTSQQALEEQ